MRGKTTPLFFWELCPNQHSTCKTIRRASHGSADAEPIGSNVRLGERNAKGVGGAACMWTAFRYWWGQGCLQLSKQGTVGGQDYVQRVFGVAPIAPKTILHHKKTGRSAQCVLWPQDHFHEQPVPQGPQPREKELKPHVCVVEGRGCDLRFDVHVPACLCTRWPP